MRARGIPMAEQGIDMDSQQPAPLHFIFQNYSHLSVCAENCQPITQARMQAEGGVPSDVLLMAMAVALTEGHGGRSLENCNLANRSSLNTTSWMSACQWHKKSSIVWSGLGKQC